MKPIFTSRRALLQALTVGAGALAFTGGGRSLVHSAQADNTAPRRLVIFPIANGVSDYSDIGVPGASPTDFSFGRFTAPIETAGLKSQTVIIDTLEMRGDTMVDTHFRGMTQLLTGYFPPKWQDQISAGISLDRYLGQKIGAGLPFAQLNLGTMCDSLSYSYNADGSSVPSTTNPLDVYTRVFGNLLPNGPDPSTLRRLARRKSVLDNVANDIGAFQKNLAAEDRVRAQAQLSVIRDMENRLSAGMPMTSTCGKPVLNDGVDYASDQFVPEALRAYVDLTVAAMACDLTRVVLMHSYLREYHPPNFNCPWSPANAPNDSFHGLSHDSVGDNFASFARAKSFHFQIAAELAQKLAAIPEAGGTMLDHTIIFLPTEIGSGHENADLQFVTIGGAGLGVKTGQYIMASAKRDQGNGVPHQRMLVALLNAMGLPDQTFGDENGSGSGPLPGYLG